MLRWFCLRQRPRPGPTARKRSGFAFADWRQTCWRPDLFLPVEAAEIAGGREISHGCSSGTRLIGSLANAAVADERCDLLIKRRRPLRAVSHPPCLRACCAVERAIVEPQIVKLYFCPSDVIFRDGWRHLAMVRNPGPRLRYRTPNVIGTAENPEWRSPALQEVLEGFGRREGRADGGPARLSVRELWPDADHPDWQTRAAGATALRPAVSDRVVSNHFLRGVHRRCRLAEWSVKRPQRGVALARFRKGTSVLKIKGSPPTAPPRSSPLKPPPSPLAP